MQKFCTMCDQYYNDPTKHRFLECPYYVGCPCGLRPATKQHMEKCFMAREKNRKEQKQKSEPQGMIKNAKKMTSLLEFTCCYCFRAYFSSKEDHEEKFCVWHTGCPKCGEKKKDYAHAKNCTGSRKERTNVPEDHDIELVCRYCRSNVPMTKWDDHMKTQCGPKTVQEIVDATEKGSGGLIVIPETHGLGAGAQSEWKKGMYNCAFCGTDIMLTYKESHEARCKEQLKSKFGFTIYTVGEMNVVDLRRTPSTKNLREVTFVEEGS